MTTRCYLICAPVVSCCICFLFLLIQIGHAEDFTTFGTISHPDGTKEGFPRIYELYPNGNAFFVYVAGSIPMHCGRLDVHQISAPSAIFGSVVGLGELELVVKDILD